MWIGCYKYGTLLLSQNHSLLLESLPAPWITPCSLDHCSLNHSLLFGSLCSLNHSLLFGSLCSLSLNLFGCPIFSRFSFIQFLASLSDVVTLHKLGSLVYIFGSLLYIFAVAWHTQLVSFLLCFYRSVSDVFDFDLEVIFLVSVPVLLGVFITLSLVIWWEVWASQWDLISAH